MWHAYQGRNFIYLWEARAPPMLSLPVFQCFSMSLPNVLLDISFLTYKRTYININININNSIYTYWEYVCFYGSNFIGYNV